MFQLLRRRRPLLSAAAVVFAVLYATELAAQTPFVPYFGKNRVRYDNFQWHIYTTDHFQIYYYPEIEQHLERVAGYAESAYQHVSTELKHDLGAKVPLVLFKTQAEFQQQNVIPSEVPEGVAAFAEPTRDRMVLPIDEPPDQLYRLITHELTHIFEFDIIPRGLVQRGIPLWVDEGLSDYMAGVWNPIDLMTVRDVAIADIVPKMTDFEGYGGFTNPRLVYNLGHACFEFMESRWGKEGVRQYIFSLRKTVIGGGSTPFEEAFRIKADEFDEQFEKYLKDRFKMFRDRERPVDYGRNLAPDARKTNFTSLLSIEPSPSGDLFAGVSGNRKEQEMDIVLISAKDGSVVRNLTPGFDKDRGFEYIAVPGARWNTVPWMSWSPVGDRLAYFARTEKQRSLIVQNVVTDKTEVRVELKAVDVPESPDWSPDGRFIYFSALKNGIGDIWQIDPDTKELTNLTQDDFADYAPTASPDGKSIVYIARVSGNNKLFKLDLATRAKTQLTFGTHDDAAPQFFDPDTLVFSSTATDPAKPITPEEARNGNIYNIWTLNLKNGELKQYTDTLTGNLSTVVLREGGVNKVAFVTYYKGEYGLHTLVPREPKATVASRDFGEPGPIIDFQAPLSHTLVSANQKKKGVFEKMFLDGRPPLNVGVTSGGDLFGGTQVSFSDVLGDKQFNMFVASISQYRTIAGSYVNLSRRMQYALQGFQQTTFFYSNNDYLFYELGVTPYIDRDRALASRTITGGTVFATYPMSRYSRFELSGGLVHFSEQYDSQDIQDAIDAYQDQLGGRTALRDGTAVPLGVAFVHEDTVFREFGPVAGSTVRLAYDMSPNAGDLLNYQSVDLDARKYFRIGTTGLFAVRFKGFKSWGENPDFTYFGGNSEMRGYEYLQFTGQKGFFANAELRFPLIEAMLTPIGVLGGVRGVLFGNIGGAGFDDQGYKFADDSTITSRPVIGIAQNPDGSSSLIYGDPITVDGWRLQDGRASYGVGLESFFLGFPLHIDYVWRTTFNKEWEDLIFGLEGGSSEWRKGKFHFWIGYDF
jgi:WD40 repeat protein